MRPAPHRQRGAALITGIFMLLLFAGLSAWMLDLGTTQETQLAQDIQGARGLQAARAGMEYGMYQVLTPTTAPSSCPAFSALSLEGFTVTISCAYSTYSETDGSNPATLNIYELTATATTGTIGSPYYIERSVRTQVCRDNATSKKNCVWS